MRVNVKESPGFIRGEDVNSKVTAQRQLWTLSMTVTTQVSPTSQIGP